MSKPVWAPAMSAKDRQDGWRFCASCGWRRTKAEFCDTCMQAAEEAPPQSPRPPPTRIGNTTKPLTDRQKEALAGLGILPVTCKICGAGDHTSVTCTTRGLTRA